MTKQEALFFFFLFILIVQSSAVTPHTVQGNISPFSHQLRAASLSIMPYLAIAARVISFFLSFFFLLLLEQKLKCFLAQTEKQSPEVTKSQAQEAMGIQGFEPTHFDSDLHEVNVHLFAEL